MRKFFCLLRRDRGAAVAVMLAVMMLPLIILAACAVDVASLIFARSELMSAADAAATHAVRIATQEYVAGSSSANAATAGIAAGKQWFAAQLGRISGATVATGDPTVQVNYQTQPGGFVATVSFQATVPTTIGSFLVPSWTFHGNAGSQLTNNYLEVLMLLDNSSSMQIGASDIDMEIMMAASPCYPANAVYSSGSQGYNSTAPYYLYQCPTNNETSVSCPVPAPNPPLSYSTFQPSPSSSSGPSCQGMLPKQSDGSYPKAGPPCAFACHSDSSKPAGTGNDFYALARSTIGTSYQVTLRFDVVKKAANALLQSMQSSASASGNLSVGIYTFNSTLTQVYPASGEAGTNFAAAAAAVGLPPTTPNTADSGIQPDPAVTYDQHADTYFASSMDALQAQVTASGNGGTPATPRKVLFIVTDGMEDDNNAPGGFDYTRCQNFKNMGYTIYVIYMQYRQLFWWYYQQNQAPLVDGTGPGTVSYNLQQCASGPNNYVAVSDQASITAAFNSFLNSARYAPLRVSQ